MKNFKEPEETDSSNALKPLKSGGLQTLLEPFSQRIGPKTYFS